jgi:putative redox protein
VTIRVVRDEQTPTRLEIQVGMHGVGFTTELGVEEGGKGEGSGPVPHDLYDAALGACTAMTVLWYAKRKSIPVQGVEVIVERDATLERSGLYRLNAVLRLTGDLSVAQRDELLRVAQQCPIHKLMTKVTTEIATSLSD